MRLIDADAIMDTIESTTWYHINRCGELVSGANSKDDTPLYRADDIYKAVSDAPTIDIVICEECRKSHIDGKTTHHLWCAEWGRSTDTFGYCERGEREGE